jgi:serine/threonine protein kinase
MTPERWQQVKAIFQQAVGLAPPDRARFVDDACAGDEELRREVRLLVEANAQPDGFTMDTRKLPVYDAGTNAGASAATRPPKVCTRCGEHFDAARDVCPADGEVLEDDPEGLVGSVIDDSYRVERLLGRGGMGAVYLARHILLRDLVALKLLPIEYRASADRMRRFLREGRLARAVRHPNIVGVHELRIPNAGPAYMVLEYVDGRTLRQVARRGPLPLGETVELLEQVADALDHAHANGLLHRDLKPENIMVLDGESEHSRVAKVLDFGIAKLFESDTRVQAGATNLTLEGQVLGTPAYMSPEQWGEIPRDGSVELDPRADVYSLAVVAFELLAGRPPFKADTTADMRRAHVRTEPPSLASLTAGASARASAAIARALSKDRADRPETAGAFVAELRAALEQSDQATLIQAEQPATPAPPEAAPPDAPAAAPQSAEVGAAVRSSGGSAVSPAAVGLALLLAVAIAGGAYWLFGREGDDAAATAEKPAALPSVERTLRYSLRMKRAGDRDGSGQPLPAPESTAFRSGDGVRVTVQSPQDGYLYVLNEAPVLDAATGLPRYTVIFPSPFSNRGAPRLPANQSVQILEQGWIEFGDAEGAETLWLVWAARPLDDLEGIGDLVNPEQRGRVTDPGRVEAIRSVLTRFAGSSSQKVTDARTNQTTLRARSDVVVHPLEFEHQ